MSLPEKEMLNRVDLSSRRNDINDGMVLTDDGRAFQARVAAAGKFGERAFSHAGPSAWNALPIHMRDFHNSDGFKKLVKTYFLD